MFLAFELLLVAIAGALVGCGTGLLPALHVNTLSILLLAMAPGLVALITSLGLTGLPPLFFVAALILAISIAHTFVNMVPATYLGAPDESTALSVLPGHKMLLRGTGFRAIEIHSYASQWAVLASVALAVPFSWILGPPIDLFQRIRDALFWVVLTLAILLVWTETAKVGPEGWTTATRKVVAKICALLVLAATALFGLLLNHLPYAALVPLPPSPLLPALSGLFGAATILTALQEPAKVPHQFLRIRHRDIRLGGASLALGSGLVAGATMSVLPGLTNASATALATTMRKGTDEETIVSLSAVNTANAVFNLAVLYLFFRTRSGAVIAMQELWPVKPWHDVVPADLAWFGFVTVATGLASMLLTLLIGRLLVRRIQSIPYRPLLVGVLVYMVLTVIVFTGLAGLLVFVVGAALGIVPVKLGLRRVALTGVLLGPVLYYLWPWGAT